MSKRPLNTYIPLPITNHRIVTVPIEMQGRTVEHMVTISEEPLMVRSCLPLTSSTMQCEAARKKTIRSGKTWSVRDAKQWQAIGFTLPQIAARFGISVPDLCDGLASDKPVVSITPNAPGTPFDIERALELYGSGQRVTAIARHFRVTASFIRRSFRARGIALVRGT